MNLEPIIKENLEIHYFDDRLSLLGEKTASDQEGAQHVFK